MDEFSPTAFHRIVKEEQAVRVALERVARAIQAEEAKFFTGGETPVYAVLIPVMCFVAKETLLPWLHEAGRWTDIWLVKFRQWVDEQYREHGLDPVQAKIASDALRQELRAVSTKEDQASWELVMKKLVKGSKAG